MATGNKNNNRRAAKPAQKPAAKVAKQNYTPRKQQPTTTEAAQNKPQGMALTGRLTRIISNFNHNNPIIGRIPIEMSDPQISNFRHLIPLRPTNGLSRHNQVDLMKTNFKESIT